MLFNIVTNQSLNSTFAIPTDAGLDDLAFDNGWRITHHAVREIECVEYIRLLANEWSELLWNMYMGDEVPLMADSDMFSPFVEDVSDSDEDEFDEDLMNQSEPETEEE